MMLVRAQSLIPITTCISVIPVARVATLLM
jgi:hypothetical protein